MANGNGFTAEEVIEAINQSKGYASKAAHLLGVGRTTFYKYLNKFSTAKQALDDAREARTDWVESKLISLIDGGNVAATIFYLKTQAKDRGYTERHEFTGKDGTPIEVETVEIIKDYGHDE
jgi:hypothetical protein